MNRVTNFINCLDDWFSPLAELSKDENFKGELLAAAGAKESKSPEQKAKAKEKLNKALQLLDDLRKKLGLDKSDVPNVSNLIALGIILAELWKVIDAVREMLKACDYFGLEDEEGDDISEDKETAIVNAMRAITIFLTRNVFKKRWPVMAAWADAAGIFADEYTETKRALDMALFPWLSLLNAGLGLFDKDINTDFLRPIGDIKDDDPLRITKGLFLAFSIASKVAEKKIKSKGQFLFNLGYELPNQQDAFPVAARVAARVMQMQFIPGAYFNAKDDEWIGDELFGATFRDSIISFATIPVFPPNAAPDTPAKGFQYLLGLDLNPGSPAAGTEEPGLKNDPFSISFPINFAGSLLWGEGVNFTAITNGPLGTAGPLMVIRYAKPQTEAEAHDVNGGDISFVIELKKTILNGQPKDDAEIRLEFNNFGLSLSGEDRDGFLQKILPDNGAAKVNASFSIVYSALQNKFSVRGLDSNEGLLLLFNVEKSLFGKLRIPTIYAGLKPYLDDKKAIRGVTLEASAQMNLSLGPFMMNVDRLGFNGSLSFPEKADGNLGAANLDVGLKPPSGIGFLVKASLIKGGGFLSIDPDNHQYYGVGELSIKLSSNTPNELELTLKVIAVILTRLPDGSKGFSFLLLASIEFSPAIDTVFGFKLKGAGVLVALHRSMNLENFQNAVSDDRLNSVLFPDNPVGNAPTIVKTLNSLFPPAEGRYVFAIMARIGWGTRKLVDIKAGLLIEVPEPLKLALAGVVTITLEEANVKILRLQLNFVVTLDMGKKIFAFQASIYNSKFLVFPIKGDAFARYRWGDDPIFLFSVGGWHPDFQVPAGLNLPAKPTRLTVPLLEDDNPSLILSCYVAFTSNTIQAGFAIDFKMKWSKFRLEAGLSVDALLQFDPIYFIVDFEGKLRIFWGDSRLAGVTVKGKFSGTTPWRIQGKATFEIWIWDYDVDFDKTFGDKASEISQESEVLPLLQKAIQDKGNWQATMPAGKSAQVVLRNSDNDLDEAPEAAPADGPILADPLARLDVTQQVAPLAVRIDKLGFQKVKDFRKFDLKAQTPDGQALAGSTLNDFFAPAMFLDLNDAEKLSRKSYEQMKAGFSFGDAVAVTTGAAQVTAFAYDNTLYDAMAPVTKPDPPVVPENHFQLWVANNSVGRSAQGRKFAAGKEIANRKTSAKGDPFVLADAVTGNRIMEVPAQNTVTAAYDEVWKLQQGNAFRKINVVRESELI